MMKKILGLLIIVSFLGACNQQKELDLILYVDPMIGTDATGNVFPGPSMPFGGVQLSPDTYNDRCCSGYHYTDNTILGFSHTHLSGTGCPDYGDVLFVPTTGELNIKPGTAEEPDNGYRSRFSHEKEVAKPGYYSVILDDYNIKAELTASNRVGFHKYTFEDAESGHVILDLEHDITGGDVPLDDCYIKVINDREIEGFRHSRGWAFDQYVYFVAQFSEPFEAHHLFKNDTKNENTKEINGSNVKAAFKFNTNKEKPLLLKVAISAVSTEGVRKNLEQEVDHWDFDKVVSQAQSAWNKELNKIQVEGGSADDKIKFYTAFYHAMLTPNLFMDVDGNYRGMDQKIYNETEFNYYNVFSLWDTYRAVHPLFNLVAPDRNLDFVKTMIRQYEHTGLLPIWELGGCENNCMIGYHSVPVIADAYLKGNTDFDVEKAFEAMDVSANDVGEGIPAYNKHQFIPRGATSNSVSKTLEYAYDDWTIAQFAKAIGKEDAYKKYIKRSQFYRNQFDPETGLMRARFEDGTWIEPFDPLKITMLDAGDYTEANAWHYSFYVPHNIPDHINLMGGDEAYTKMLDTFFTLENEDKDMYSDFVGKFGQYAHGNEPSHHMPYLYNYTGKAWKTQELVRKTMDELYTTAPDGLCGNDDCGQLSAWYMFGTMGFYPVCPGQDQYVIGSPVFDKVTINLPNGKKFVINSINNSKENCYIQSATMNGEIHPFSYIKHSDIVKGGKITFKMGNSPNEDWGTKSEHRPFAEPIEQENILPELGANKVFMPFTKADKKVFNNNLSIELGSVSEDSKIFYTLDGSEPNQNSTLYSKPINITTTTLVKARAYKKGIESSDIMEKYFYKSGISKSYKKMSVEYLAPISGKDCGGMEVDGLYAPQYKASGDLSLIDGKLGTPHFSDGLWQGFNGKDMTIVIDLKKQQEVKYISAGFLQNIGVWIFYPEQVNFMISSNGIDFKKVAQFDNPISRNHLPEGTKYFTHKVDQQSIRYIKIHAKAIGFCPEWHEGKGGKAWIFSDEIIIE